MQKKLNKVVANSFSNYKWNLTILKNWKYWFKISRIEWKENQRFPTKIHIQDWKHNIKQVFANCMTKCTWKFFKFSPNSLCWKNLCVIPFSQYFAKHDRKISHWTQYWKCHDANIILYMKDSYTSNSTVYQYAIASFLTLKLANIANFRKWS